MTSVIPNVFHFVFGLRPQTEPFHLMHYLCLRSCLEVMRPDAIRFHYQNEPFGPLWEAIKPHLDLVAIKPVTLADTYTYTNPDINAFRYAHISDFVRLEILLREGGIYADIDTLFIRPFPVHLRRYNCFMGREKPPHTHDGQGSLCNALIGASPQSPFCTLWLHSMATAFDGTWSNHSTLLPYRLSQAHSELIHVEPEKAFFALDWTPDGLSNLFLRRQSLDQDCYSLHLWSHLWFDPARRDFCSFNGKLLTEDYLAFASTTYADYARRFLPPTARPNYARYLVQRSALIGHSMLGKSRQIVRAIYHSVCPLISAPQSF